MRKHIVISGTGRTGTTFLVELFTNLGFDTGVNTNKVSSKKEIANAGLEYDIRKDDAPYIVKSPNFCDYAQDVIARKDIHIEHVIIPMRNLEAAAESRRHVSKINYSKLSFTEKFKSIVRKLVNRKDVSFHGGLWSTNRANDQELVLLEKLYNLVLALSETHIPVTLIKYPRHLNDSMYLFEKLKPILGDMEYAYFQEVHQKTVKPDLIHRFKGETSV